VFGDQPQLFATAASAFPWDRFFDQGEQVFEAAFLVLWLAFVVFLAGAAVRLVNENAKKKGKSRKKRCDRSSSTARDLR